MAKKLRPMTMLKLKALDLAQTEYLDIQTDKGELFFVDAYEPADGVEVFMLDEDGARVMPEDGDYTWENKVLVVRNGVIESIRDVEDNNNNEDMSKKRLQKLETEVVTPSDLNEVIDAVNELIELVDDLVPEEVPTMIEELKATKQKLSAVEVSLSEMKSVSETTLNVVEKMQKNSNKEFVDTKLSSDKVKKSTGLRETDVIDYFKI